MIQFSRGLLSRVADPGVVDLGPNPEPILKKTKGSNPDPDHSYP